MGTHFFFRAPHARATWTTLALASGLGLTACKGGDEVGPSPAAGGKSAAASTAAGGKAAAASTGSTAGGAPVKPPAPAGPAPMSAQTRAAFEEALLGLPADTRLALVAASPRTWLALADFAGLRTRYASLFAPASAEIVRETGLDLLDPAVIQAQLGVDLDAPISFAMLRLFQPRMVFGFRLTDSAKFTAGVTALFAKAAQVTLRPRPLDGGATWLPLTGEEDRHEAGFVVTPTRAWLVVHDQADAALLAFDARRIAAGKPGGGLAAEVDFKTAWEGLTGGAHLRGYLNVRQLISSLVAEFSGSGRTARVREQVEARQAGLGDSSDLPALQEELRTLEADRTSQLAGGAALSLAVQSYAGGMSALGFGLDVGEKTVDFQVALKATEAALVQRLSTDGPARPHPLLGLQAPDQTFGLAVAANPEGMMGLARQINLLTGGRAMEEITRELKRESSLDLETEIVPNLSGEFGLLSQLKPNAGTTPSELTLTLALGVKDPVVAGPLVDRWAQHRATTFEDPKTDGRPTTGRGPDRSPLQLALVGDQVLITTESALFDGLAKGAATATAAADKVRALWPDALHPHTALLVFHWGPIAVAEARRVARLEEVVEAHTGEGYTDVAKAKALHAEQSAAAAKRYREELAAVEKITTGVGGLTARLDTRGERADLRLRQTFTRPVAAMIDELVAFAQADHARSRAYYEVSERTWEALRALEVRAPE